MRIWLIVLGLLILELTVGTTPVLADTSSDVTVTATGYICEAPGGLTLIYISDYEVGISWIKGLDSVNTMVRAKYGSVPTSRTDGYLVYYGAESNASDTGVSLDETVTPIYYRAWAENSGGAWEDEGVSGFFEGGGMTLIGILLLCGIVSFIALRNSFFGLKLIAGMSWFAFFIYFKDNPPAVLTEGSSAHAAILVVAIGFGLMIVLSGLGRGITRSKKWQTGEETMGGDFQWKLPNWMKINEDAPEQRTKKTDEAINDYRETLRRAYRSGEFSNRRRR